MDPSGGNPFPPADDAARGFIGVRRKQDVHVIGHHYPGMQAVSDAVEVLQGADRL